MDRRESLKTIGLISSGILLYQCTPLAGKAEEEYFTISYRLHPDLFTTDAQFNTTAGFFKKHRKAVNELALFDETLPSAPCAPLDFVTEMAEIHQTRMPQFKDIGIPRVGINVLNNLGHGNRAGIWEMPYQPMIGHDGKESLCPCPNDPEFRDYLNKRYQLMAQADPDFIWMDDDFRMISHGVRYPCFCPICMEKFDQADERADLVHRLNQPGNDELRYAWTSFCNQTLISLAEELKKTVKNVNPGIEIGLMTIGYSNSTYAGNDMNSWMKAFGATMGRPGHGFYRDDQPRQITGKIFDVARQVRDYPHQVKRIEYELENWPYITLNKSTSTVINESIMSIMAGGNGIAYNIFYERENNNLKEYDPLLMEIAVQRPVWEEVTKLTRELQLNGFWPMDNPDLMVNRKVDNRGWFYEGSEYNIQAPNELAEVGIPFSNSYQNSCGVLMSGRIAESFSDEDLKEMLSGAVYLDTAALGVLWERGLGEFTGVKHINNSIRLNIILILESVYWDLIKSVISQLGLLYSPPIMAGKFCCFHRLLID